uniref:non-specific serine/threonine protein kinase n=1 Tax=Hordeum vulgare subsp. vulgare TaxID=112509 RepID=A0A8I6XJY3_HORVV
MAAAIMNPHHLLSVSVYIIICLCYSVGLATALSFSFNFSSPGSGDLCETELRCERDACMGSGAIELTRNDIVANIFSVGRASYARPVPLWDDVTGKAASFFSNFTFQIKPQNRSEDNFRLCNMSFTADGNADGMSFFLAPYPSRIPPNSGGANLALFNASNGFNSTGERLVAVEFDTYLNSWSWDHNDNHMGIDISYDNHTGILAALLRIDGDGPPYSVNTSVDMKRELPRQVSVGFAASTGLCAELHRVASWSFSSTLDDAPVPSNNSPRRRLPSVHVLVPSATAAFLVFLCGVAAAAFIVRQRWKRKSLADSDENKMLADSDDEENEQAEFERGVEPRRYRYRELAAATKDFADEEKLGRGGFGIVYRGGGLSDHGSPVAIKMLSMESSAQGRKEFEAEVKIISRLRHRNLVDLLGWSDSNKGQMLVYELLREGSLDKHIYSTSRLLTWSERYEIILGLGSALRYLHTECDQCVLHGDIKPSNILLDSSWSTKLADFGLAKLVDHGARPKTTKIIKGTEWYIDPEFLRSYHRTPAPSGHLQLRRRSDGGRFRQGPRNGDETSGQRRHPTAHVDLGPAREAHHP